MDTQHKPEPEESREARLGIVKQVRVVLSPDAEEVFLSLNKEAANSKIESSILRAIQKKVELIKANIHYGVPVAKNLIPAEYKIKYGITNLFRVELPNYWRMLYTLTDGDTTIEIVAFVLDIMDHKKYNKKFGYK
ncbi:MAG: hypothetical protein WC852_02310 [Candidatus Nanoarchaeia archaeon]|jgi:hypothetical protein